MPRMRPIQPELLAHARKLYEQTDMPPNQIAAFLGVRVGTFYWRVRHKWGWIRRHYFLPRTLPRRRRNR
ncbi:MAG: hypothetical protein WD688_01740 [Candidatus Binatia bacterium]